MGRRNYTTYEDVCKHANELTASRGLAILLLLIIERYHATRICDIPEDRYDEFIRRCIWLKNDLPSMLSGEHRRTLTQSPEGTYKSGLMTH
jgi:hypothetical protein